MTLMDPSGEFAVIPSRLKRFYAPRATQKQRPNLVVKILLSHGVGPSGVGWGGGQEFINVLRQVL